MAHFFGRVAGPRSAATRLGTKRGGLRTLAASWAGAVEVELYHIADTEGAGQDRARIKLVPHMGRGVTATLYDGPVDKAPL